MEDRIKKFKEACENIHGRFEKSKLQKGTHFCFVDFGTISFAPEADFSVLSLKDLKQMTFGLVISGKDKGRLEIEA